MDKTNNYLAAIRNFVKKGDTAEAVTALAALEDYIKNKRESAPDNQVNHPAHYQPCNKELHIECIDAMRAAFGDEAVANFCICNAFKYTWRHQSKNGKQDIEKAQWYLNKYLELNK